MKKRISVILIIFLVFINIGCRNKETKDSIDLFEIQEATKFADNYMEKFTSGNIEESSKMLSEKIVNDNGLKNVDDSKICAYKIDEIEEASNHAYINYLVIRNRTDEVRADLDIISLKVYKKDNKYYIDEIRTKSNKQVYVDKGVLRIRDETTGKSEVLLRRKDLPREVYPKGGNITIKKEQVPVGEFAKVTISFSGEKVGILTSDGENIFIAMASVAESKATVGNPAGGNENEEQINMAIDEALEKPIVDKLFGYDLIKNCSVEKVMFSTDDSELIIQLKEKNKGNKIRIYKNPTGELMELQLESLFPNDKYSTTINRVTKEGVFINVNLINGEGDANGEYKVDLKSMKINKLENK